MQDPISDMIVRIKNALIGKPSVAMPASKQKLAIAKVLKDEGYIVDFYLEQESKPTLVIVLKYVGGESVIKEIRRISRPGLRHYAHTDKLPKVLGGLGVAIVSTSSGLMTDRQARKLNVGGEVLLSVS
jgi:small subunit ribosomal protein S8